MRVSMATNKLKNQYYPSQDAGTVCSTSGPGCELPPHPLALTTAGREELNALARLRVYESKKKLKELYPTYVTITKEEQMNPAHFASLFS